MFIKYICISLALFFSNFKANPGVIPFVYNNICDNFSFSNKEKTLQISRIKY